MLSSWSILSVERCTNIYLKESVKDWWVKFGGSVFAWVAETLASVPSSTSNSKQQQLLQRSISH